MRNALFVQGLLSEGTSDVDSDEEVTNCPKRKPFGVNFRCAPRTMILSDDTNSLFVLDAVPAPSTESADVTPEATVNKKKEERPEQRIMPETLSKSVLDDDSRNYVEKLLSKSRVSVGFEKNPVDCPKLHISRREEWRKRKAEKEKTTGSDWFNLPATDMTEEKERDLRIIQMRDALDTKTHYKKNDRSVLPKYFQVGTVIESKADFYSSRIPKKLRKRTIVEELMADAEFQTKQRKRYQEIRAREAVTNKGAFRHRTFPKKRKRISHHN